LLAANHQSYLDPILVSCVLHRPTAFLARAELFKNPLFGRLIRSLQAVPIQQGRGDRGALMQSIDLLRGGHLMILYPEGSRSPDGSLQPLLPGIALVIRKAGVPVIPVGIAGSYTAWPRSQKLPAPRPVSVVYGPPMQLGEDTAEEILRKLTAAIADLVDRATRHAPAPTPADWAAAPPWATAPATP
jgi:1-acyl-sn-glycerol-3-phosphate acyltransferase